MVRCRENSQDSQQVIANASTMRTTPCDSRFPREEGQVLDWKRLTNLTHWGARFELCVAQSEALQKRRLFGGAAETNTAYMRA